MVKKMSSLGGPTLKKKKKKTDSLLLRSECHTFGPLRSPVQISANYLRDNKYSKIFANPPIICGQIHGSNGADAKKTQSKILGHIM